MVRSRLGHGDVIVGSSSWVMAEVMDGSWLGSWLGHRWVMVRSWLGHGLGHGSVMVRVIVRYGKRSWLGHGL